MHVEVSNVIAGCVANATITLLIEAGIKKDASQHLFHMF
jgi:hypothetical protein